MLLSRLAEIIWAPDIEPLHLGLGYPKHLLLRLPPVLPRFLGGSPSEPSQDGSAHPISRRESGGETDEDPAILGGFLFQFFVNHNVFLVKARRMGMFMGERPLLSLASRITVGHQSIRFSSALIALATGPRQERALVRKYRTIMSALSCPYISLMRFRESIASR